MEFKNSERNRQISVFYDFPGDITGNRHFQVGYGKFYFIVKSPLLENSSKSEGL